MLCKIEISAFLIKPPRLEVPAYSDRMKRWNICKAHWSSFCLLTGGSVETTSRQNKHRQGIPGTIRQPCIFGKSIHPVLPSHKLCAKLRLSARSSIAPYFLRAQLATESHRTASSLLLRINQKKQKRWEEGVTSIDSSHSSCKAWNTINKPTGPGTPLLPVQQTSSLQRFIYVSVKPIIPPLLPQEQADFCAGSQP